MPRFQRKNSPFQDIEIERVRDADGGKSFNISVTIDANPHDQLAGLELTFTGAPTPFLLPTLFGLDGFGFCRGGGLDRGDFKALKALIDKTKMLEGAFEFRFTDDGAVEAAGCYFCDVDGDGVAEDVRKCPSFTSDEDATGNTLVDDLVFALSGGDALAF